MRLARYPVHRLIQDLMADPEGAAAFACDPEPVFAKYGLNEEERAALRDGTPAALIALRVHPNLQMKYRRIKDPAATAGPGPLAEYLHCLIEEG